jgi:hypothetical protein
VFSVTSGVIILPLVNGDGLAETTQQAPLETILLQELHQNTSILGVETLPPVLPTLQDFFGFMEETVAVLLIA